MRYDQKITIIDSFLLSCRVLGREIETAALFWLCQYLKRKNIYKIYGKIHKTKRNEPVQDLYTKHGFKKINNSKFELNLKNHVIKKATRNQSKMKPKFMKQLLRKGDHEKSSKTARVHEAGSPPAGR